MSDWGLAEVITEMVSNAIKPQLKEMGDPFSSINADVIVSLINDKVYPLQKLAFVYSEDEGIGYTSAVKIDSSRVLVVNQYTSGYESYVGKAVVLSIDGTIITAGTPFEFSNTNALDSSLVLVDTDKALLVYRNGTDALAVVLSISGTTITAGSPLTVKANMAGYIQAIKLDTNKALAVYSDSGNSYYGTAVVLSVSGTTVTKGSAFVFESARINGFSLTAVANTRALVAYSDDGNSDYGTVIMLSISETTITKGNAVVFESATILATSVTLIDTDKVLLIFKVGGGYGMAAVLSISTLVITVGTIVQFREGNTTSISVVRVGVDKAVVSYHDGDNSGAGTSVILSVVGTTITVHEPFMFDTGSSTILINIILYDTNKLMAVFMDNYNLGQAIVFAVNGNTLEGDIVSSADGITVSASAYVDGVNKVAFQPF